MYTVHCAKRFGSEKGANMSMNCVVWRFMYVIATDKIRQNVAMALSARAKGQKQMHTQGHSAFGEWSYLIKSMQTGKSE